MSGRWRGRIALTALVVAGGWLATWAMDFEPRPVLWVLLATLGCAVVWLVLDATDTGAAEWSPPPLPVEDRIEPTTPERRVVDNHLASSHPGPALAERLLALARARDPELADPDLRALADDPHRRLRSEEISRIIARIENLREGHA